MGESSTFAHISISCDLQTFFYIKVKNNIFKHAPHPYAIFATWPQHIVHIEYTPAQKIWGYFYFSWALTVITNLKAQSHKSHTKSLWSHF